jgi:hypothetical protein
MMSLQPDWYSTIYGFLIISGQALAGMALAIACLPLLLADRALAEFVTPQRLRDLGALLFTLVIFYAYIAFSQYLIIWSGNLPQEVTWYLNRTGGWLVLFLVVVAVQFILPFAALLSLRAKENLRLLAGLSLATLAMRFLDTFWHVAPTFHPGRLYFHWLDLALAAGIGGLWLLAFTFHLSRTPFQAFVEPEAEGRVAPERKESTV